MQKVAIVAIAKNEQKYIIEWMQYYKKLGVSHIYLFDNNDCDDNSMFEILQPYRDFISIFDARGDEKFNSMNRQYGCYMTAFNTFHTLYDWMGFFDIDEFLYLYDMNISDFLESPKFNDTQMIHFNWRYYGDNDLVFYDDRPVQERFTTPAPDDVRYAQDYPENNWVKSVIRCNSEPFHIQAHTAFYKNENTICRRANGLLGHINSVHEPYNFEGGYVKHYGTKTIAEYIERKCLNTAHISDTTLISAEDRLKWFFNVNRHQKYKDLLANFICKMGNV